MGDLPNYPDEFIEVATDVEDGRLVMAFNPPTEELGVTAATAGVFRGALRAARPRLNPSAPPVEGSDGIDISTGLRPRSGAQIKFPRVVERIVLNAAQVDWLDQEVDDHVPRPFDWYFRGPDGVILFRSGRAISKKVLRLPPSFEGLIQGYRDARAAGCRNREEDEDFLRQKYGADVFDAIPQADRNAAFKQAAKGQKSRRGQPRKMPLPRIK
jgi:hypothetical protein